MLRRFYFVGKTVSLSLLFFRFFCRCVMIRFLDRDNDGYITLDDILTAQAMILQRSEGFLKVRSLHSRRDITFSIVFSSFLSFAVLFPFFLLFCVSSLFFSSLFFFSLSLDVISHVFRMFMVSWSTNQLYEFN
jgi:hypothetical protein